MNALEHKDLNYPQSIEIHASEQIMNLHRPLFAVSGNRKLRGFTGPGCSVI